MSITNTTAPRRQSFDAGSPSSSVAGTTGPRGSSGGHALQQMAKPQEPEGRSGVGQKVLTFLKGIGDRIAGLFGRENKATAQESAERARFLDSMDRDAQAYAEEYGARSGSDSPGISARERMRPPQRLPDQVVTHHREAEGPQAEERPQTMSPNFQHPRTATFGAGQPSTTAPANEVDEDDASVAESSEAADQNTKTKPAESDELGAAALSLNESAHDIDDEAAVSEQPEDAAPDHTKTRRPDSDGLGALGQAPEPPAAEVKKNKALDPDGAFGRR